MLLHTYQRWSIDENHWLINFVKIKFHLNENIGWNCNATWTKLNGIELNLNLKFFFIQTYWMEFQFHSISIQLNSIQQLDSKLIEMKLYASYI
jgi:hypothetical protein